MAITIRDYLNNAKFVRDNILNETERIVYKNETEIIKLNTAQIEEGKGSDDNVLKNSNNMFSGRYTLSTQLIDSKKTAGELYSFFDTGNFYRGFQIEMSQDLTKVYIYSTGTGSGDKSVFFAGYDNIFGLNTQNSFVFNEELRKDLNQFIQKYL